MWELCYFRCVTCHEHNCHKQWGEAPQWRKERWKTTECHVQNLKPKTCTKLIATRIIQQNNEHSNTTAAVICSPEILSICSWFQNSPKQKNVLYLVRLLERAQALLISLLHGMNGQILIFVLLLVEQPHVECTIVFSQLQLVLESRQVEQCLRTEFGNDKAQGTRDDTGKWTIRSINVNMVDKNFNQTTWSYHVQSSGERGKSRDYRNFRERKKYVQLIVVMIDWPSWITSSWKSSW